MGDGDIDAVGLAPYINGCNADTSANDASKMLASFQQEISVTAALVKGHVDLIAAKGLKAVAYEAGPGGTGSGGVDDFCMAAHRDPAMAALVRDYYAALADSGLTTIVHFNSVGKPSKYGSHGLIEAQDTNPRFAPKEQGLLAFIEDIKEGNCTFSAPRCGSAGDASADKCNGHGMCLPDGSCSCWSSFRGSTCDQFEWCVGCVSGRTRPCISSTYCNLPKRLFVRGYSNCNEFVHAAWISLPASQRCRACTLQD